MKKLLLATLSISLFSAVDSVGQIVNAGFENWTSLGSCSDPDGWNSPNNFSQSFSICLVEEETVQVYGGSSAVKLETKFLPAGIDEVPGMLTNGTIDLQNQAFVGGQAFTERPALFSGWYVAAPEVGNTYSFRALLIKENANPSLNDTIGSAFWGSTAVVSSFTQFVATVDYYSADAPTLLQIILSSSDIELQPIVGSTVIFDDLDYELTTVGMDEYQTNLIRTYPNPVVEDVFFNLGKLETGIINVFNVLGEQVLQHTLTASENRISMASLPVGTYIWQLSSLEGAAVKTGKIVLTK